MKKIYFLLLLLGLTFSTSYAQVTSVALVGEAAGGWPGDAGNPGPNDVHQLTSLNGTDWNLTSITLTTAQSGGGIKFRANNAWLISWGAAQFPAGTAAVGGANIGCTAGTFSVTFNSTSGVYVFTPIASSFPTIAIVGSATTQGWPTDPQVDTEQLATSDGIIYKSNLVNLTTGAVKFRQNNNFTVSWGGISFPTGPQAGGGNDNIAVTTPGKYRIVFNRITGVYTFDFPAISIVGEAVGGWPGDPGNPGPTDLNQLITTDGNIYTKNNLVVTTATVAGGAKFRQDNAWLVAWGNEAFPSATSSNGNNISTIGGTYNITFTRSTGAFNFVNTLNASSFTKLKVMVYPNPTNSNWNFSMENDTIKSVKITDISGKLIISTTENSIDASDLNAGVYFAQVETEAATEILKLLKK